MALNISRGVVFKPQKVVIYGPEGIGKSRFASHFPEPLFIDTEGSTNLMDVARMPRPSSWIMLLSMIRDVKGTPGCCKTLVIDTIDWAEQLCVEHVCAIYSKKGIEDFGYGNGYVYVQEEFGRMLNLLTDLTECGINVVLTAHAQIRKFEQPDECGSYDRYELKLGKKTASKTSSLVKEWADMVLFANYKVHVVEVDRKKKSSGGSRVMYTTHHPCWDAKNRHDLKPELPFDYMQIAYCIPNHTDDAPIQVAATTPASEPKQETAVSQVSTAPAKKTEPVKQSEEPKNSLGDLTGLPKSLIDLMTFNSVSAEEIQKVVSQKGYYPKDTPVKNYDPGFIDGCLIGAWEQVFNMIVDNREIPF